MRSRHYAPLYARWLYLPEHCDFHQERFWAAPNGRIPAGRSDDALVPPPGRERARVGRCRGATFRGARALPSSNPAGKIRTVRRSATVAFLGGVATASVVLSWGPLRNLFRSYQDSPPIVYVLLGAFFLSIAVAAVVLAARVYRGPKRTQLQEQDPVQK